MSRAVVFLKLCLLAFSLPGLCQEAEFSGKCVSIPDGDTSGSEIPLEDAKALGYESCSVCFPRAPSRKAQDQAPIQRESSTYRSPGQSYQYASDQQVQPQTQQVTVYVTRTAEKYHREGCQYLRESKIATTLEKTKASGYTPCSRCSPPR